MAIKISQLTSKTEKAASTDLVEIAESSGGGYVSKKVAVADLIEVVLDTSPQLGGNLDVNGFNISSTGNASIVIAPDGTGDVHLNTDSVRIGDNNADATIVTRGTGDLILRTHEGDASQGSIRIYDGANGNIELLPNGSGSVLVGGNSTQATELRFREDSDNGTNYVGLKAADNLATSTTYTLPTSDGTSGQVLKTDGSGNLSWNNDNNSGTVTSVSALTLGTTGTDLSSTVANSTTTPVITLNVPTASATNRGALSSADWTTFNNKQNALTLTTTGTSGAATLIGSTLNIPQYSGGGSSLTVGTTAIASGTIGNVFFQGSGNVLQQSANLFWDNTNSRLGIGTSSSGARLDVRAQGALSTDIAFRVQNSNASANLISFTGDGQANFSSGSNRINFYEFGHGMWASGNATFRIKNMATASTTSLEATSTVRLLTDTTAKGVAFDGRQLHIGSTNLPTINGDSCITFENGTAPTTAISNRFYLYSAAVATGNAAPHFRTENGDIIKLYRVAGWGLPTGTFTRTTFDTATVTTAQLAERVAALIQDLRDNHGLLKA